MDWYYLLIFSIGGALVLLTIVSIVFSLVLPVLDKWNKRYLVTHFSLQLLCMVACFIDAIIYNNPEMVILERIDVFFEFLLLVLIVAMPSILLSHYAGEKIKTGLLSELAIVFAMTHIILLIIAQFTDIFYQITPNNEIQRGPLFPLLVAPAVVIMLFDIVGIFVIRKKLLKGYFISFLVYLIPLTIITILHMFFSLELFIILALGLWALTILVLVVKENSKEYLKQQKEIANQRANILMLQMRPHFIYNTMTSIYHLCEQDPHKAKQVTFDFTTYLRKNFAAIASDETISFVDELEHTRAYLAVEQAQFEDNLFVDFDTPHTLFRVPPLTLQPIVENAVKHGMISSNKPIHITIKTRKTDTANKIIVEDDGPGYKKTDNNEPHIALNNLYQRLEMMCNGTIEISSNDMGGTSVEITIPLVK